MNLRKTLALGAAMLATGALGLAPTATASTPTGGAPQHISVGGASSTNGYVPITGSWGGGTASFGGGIYGCVSGSVAGTVRRGAYPTPDTPEMIFSTLNIICATVFGNAMVTLDPSCVANLEFDAARGATNVHDGLVDTTTGAKFHRVPGQLAIDYNCPANVAVLGNLCSAKVSGTAPAYFDEALPAGSQTLGLNGVGLSLSRGTGLCSSILNGPFTLNDVKFTITSPAVDLRLTPPPPPIPPTEYVAVEGTSSPDGDADVSGTYTGGTASFGGGTYGCVSGTLDGTVRRGTYVAGPEMSFPTLGLTCATPFGINAVITMDPGCDATVDFDIATNIHDGLVDTGTGPTFQRVPGTVAISPSCPARVSVLGNLCTSEVSGTATAYFDENVKTGNVQTLGLTGSGLTLTNGTGLCGSVLNGPFNLNNIRFDTSPNIDFRLTPLP